MAEIPLRALLVWLSTFALVVGVESERDVLRRALSHEVTRLAQAQAQVQSACAAAAVVVPGGLGDVLVVRRTIAVDWQRRLGDPAAVVDAEAVKRFQQELTTLVAALQQLANLAQQLGEASRRFPHCLEEPAFGRYRALVGEMVERGIQVLIAGRMKEYPAPAAWHRRQSRHVALLQVIESTHRARERYAGLPADDRWLLEYQQHLRLMRETLEHGLDTLEGHDNGVADTLRQSYERLLDARVDAIERLAECALPEDAPSVSAYRRALAGQVAMLGDLIDLARSEPAEDEQAPRRQRVQESRQMASERLLEVADTWLSFDLERREQRTQLAEALAEGSAEIAAPLRAEGEAIERDYAAAGSALQAAITAGDVRAAVMAEQMGERLCRRGRRLVQRVPSDLDLAMRESEWRVHRADPAIAERLRAWDEQRSAALAARQAADAADAAALTAEQQLRLAEMDFEQAYQRAGDLEDASLEHEHRLQDLMNALDKMVELRQGQDR
jgi:hypothetical protein